VSVGLFVAADEPVIFFSSVEAAEGWMEEIDVENGVYTAAFGPAGEPYHICATGGGGVVISPADEPSKPDELKSLLLRYFEAVGQPVDSGTDLTALIARCEPHYC
jgi:hypothetical protein